MRYRLNGDEPVEWKSSKFDDCVIRATGSEYRQQKGSGRSAVLALAKDGMTLGELGQEACKIGFNADFAVDCAFKQHNTKGGAWRVDPPDGLTMDQVKARKTERALSPEQAAAKQAREAEVAQKKAAKELERQTAKAAKEQAAAEAKAAKEKAIADAKAAAGATQPGAEAKPKGKGKKPVIPAGATPEQQAEAQANV